MEKNRIYAAIDLKSFYASVECIERGLDPLDTHLVVADASRTEKTICLAVSPSLKTYGIPGRARLFEVVQRVKEVNDQRLRQIPEHCFSGSSFDKKELEKNSHLAVDDVVATPRMAHYMEYSTRVYQIYLKYLAPEDIAGRVKVTGRGGTILQPGVDCLEQANDFPKDGPILIITDGEIENDLKIRREHAFLLPRGNRLPFRARGEVFYFRE
mgnify:FL=1